jgi:hypothetical protein
MSTPTHADAELILRLYDLRRETELRKARAWWIGTFWPQSADDVIAVIRAMNTQENAWFRQVGGYWGMASSFVARGVLNEDLFLEPSVSGEMFFIYAKVEPFLKELREKMQNPGLFSGIEKVVTGSQAARDRFAQTSKNVENARKARQEAARQEAKAS